MDKTKLFLKRIYGAIIDIAVVMIPLMVIYYTYLNSVGNNEKIDYSVFIAENAIAVTLLLLIYFYICEIVGGSVGKKIFSIKTVYKKNENLAKFLRPIFKVITYYLPVLCVFNLFNENHLMYYDYILHTDIDIKKYERKDLRG